MGCGCKKATVVKAGPTKPATTTNQTITAKPTVTIKKS